MKEVNYKNDRIRKAFTLIEVMLLLVVLSLVFASSATVITRKHKLKPRRSVHGTYICYRNRDDGNLHEIMYSGKSLLRENNHTTNPAFTECSFEAPTTASYIYIQLVGGGGAGGNPNHSVYTSSSYSWVKNNGVGLPAISFLHNIESTGMDSDYVHGFKWNDKTFSVKWFRKFLRDNKVKIAFYDFAGSGADGGNLLHNYISQSLQDEVLPTDPSNVYYWVKSTCNYGYSSQNSLTPFECLQRLMYYDRSFAVAPGLSYNYKSAAADPYCQMRTPLYKNCPFMKFSMQPVINTFTCYGGTGGQGGLISSPIFDFDFGYSYQRGERVSKDSDGHTDFSKTIDWKSPDVPSSGTYSGEGVECLVGIDFPYDFATAHPGELLTTAEACPDGISAGCHDDYGREIKDPVDINGYVASAYEYSDGYLKKTYVCDTDPETGNQYNCRYEYLSTGLGYFPISLTYNGETFSSPLYFKKDKYPYLDYVYQKADQNNTCLQPDSNNYGATKGRDGGLPYFENALGMKVGEGIKVCKDGACTLYSSTDTSITYDGSFVAGKGGEGAYSVDGMLDDRLLKAGGTSLCPSNLNGASGSTSMKLPGSFGTCAYCSEGVAITIKQQKGDCDILGSGATGRISSYYGCPRSRHTSSNYDIGLSIAHYNGSMRMYYGEKGYAGNYRSLFARSFGDSSLKMEPGRGGTALPVSSGSNTPGNNGEPTKLSTGCDADGNNCDVVVSVTGGLGGRSHLYEESTEYVPLTNEEIYEFATNPQKAPEPKYSPNYEDGTYIGDDSEFQQVSFLSDLSMIENGEVVALIGKGGNAGYVKHNCWLRPQYFVYKYYGYGYNSSASNSYNVEIPNIDGDEYTPEGETFDEWEGYTNMNSAMIQSIEACRKDGKSPENQFEETQATNGYPGAIVIMW